MFHAQNVAGRKTKNNIIDLLKTHWPFDTKYESNIKNSITKHPPVFLKKNIFVSDLWPKQNEN